MKINSYWLSRLPEGLRKAYIDNFISQRSELDLGEYLSNTGSYPMFINALQWRHTKEGENFWRTICNHGQLFFLEDNPISDRKELKSIGKYMLQNKALSEEAEKLRVKCTELKTKIKVLEGKVPSVIVKKDYTIHNNGN